MTLIPHDSEDLYHLFLVLVAGDIVKSQTSRRIKGDEEQNTSSMRINVSIAIEVESVEFQGFGDSLRIKGIIKEASDNLVQLNSHHTISLQPLKKVTIIKKKWTYFAREQLLEQQLGQRTNIILIAMDDDSAIVAMVGSHATKILLELEPTITRKSSDPIAHQTQTQEFFHELATFLDEQFERMEGTIQVLGGPGFTAEAFMDFLRQNKGHLAKCTTCVALAAAGRSGLQELIQNHLPTQDGVENDAKKQLIFIDTALSRIAKNSGNIAYGSHLPQAIEYGAVERLLVLDSELQQSVGRREELDELMEQTRQMGGKVTIISSMHPSSEMLTGFGGVLALLRFRLPASIVDQPK